MAPERTHSRIVLDAVIEARRIRGSVVIVDPADEAHLWGAVVAAVDGSLEVRVAQPRGRLWKRATAKEAWLGDHGFHPIVDAWALPLPSTSGDEEAAGWLSDALAGALAVDTASAVRSFVAPGQLQEDMPPGAATHEEQIAAALRAVASGRMRGAMIGGGRPEKPWAAGYAVDGRLFIEREIRDAALLDTDDWEAPLTADGCEDAARELMRRTAADWPDAAEAPLFLQLLELDSG